MSDSPPDAPATCAGSACCCGCAALMLAAAFAVVMFTLKHARWW